MTTFTLQDLTLPTTPEDDEAMDALARLGGGIGLKEMFTQMGQDLTQTQMGELLPNPTTVISQAKAQPNTTPPEGESDASN